MTPRFTTLGAGLGVEMPLRQQKMMSARIGMQQHPFAPHTRWSDIERNLMTNRDRVIALYQAYSARDAQAIAALLHDEVVWVAPPGNATQIALGLGRPEDAGPPNGSNNLAKGQIVHFMSEQFGRLFATDVTNEFKGIYQDGDFVIAEHRLSATLAHGRRYTNDYCFVFRFVDGLIVEIREYMDTRGGWFQMWGEEEPRKIA